MTRSLDYGSVSERDWTAQVLDLLDLHGWHHDHTFEQRVYARRSSRGFPDVLAIHPKAGDLLVAELKTEKGKLTAEQAQWLAWFEAAGVETHVWRPSQVDAVIERIQVPVKRLRRSEG